MVPGLLLLGVNQGLKQETVNDTLALNKETSPKTAIQTPKVFLKTFFSAVYWRLNYVFEIDFKRLIAP